MRLALFGPWFPHLYNNGLRPGHLLSLSVLMESSNWYAILRTKDAEAKVKQKGKLVR